MLLIAGMEFEQRTYDTPDAIAELADILRRRATAEWTTLLSARTSLLVADALDSYKPAAAPQPAPDNRFHVDLYGAGSTIYRLMRNGEILEIAAWAQSTLVAHAAFDRLNEQYPGDRFMQKRRSWVERE